MDKLTTKSGLFTGSILPIKEILFFFNLAIELTELIFWTSTPFGISYIFFVSIPKFWSSVLICFVMDIKEGFEINSNLRKRLPYHLFFSINKSNFLPELAIFMKHDFFKRKHTNAIIAARKCPWWTWITSKFLWLKKKFNSY